MKFSDLAPEIFEAKPNPAIAAEVIHLVVELAQWIRKSDDKAYVAILRELDSDIGSKVLCHELIELSVVLGFLCQKLDDGGKKRVTYSYLNHQASRALALDLLRAKDILDQIAFYVEEDLQECVLHEILHGKR